MSRDPSNSTCSGVRDSDYAAAQDSAQKEKRRHKKKTGVTKRGKASQKRGKASQGHSHSDTCALNPKPYTLNPKPE
jgi:hypothetical protein